MQDGWEIGYASIDKKISELLGIGEENGHELEIEFSDMSELKKYFKEPLRLTVHQCTLEGLMRKHYGQVVKTCVKMSICISTALKISTSGVLSYVIKGKVIAILEIIAGIIAFCAVIFIRNKRNESVNNFLEIMAKSL